MRIYFCQENILQNTIKKIKALGSTIVGAHSCVPVQIRLTQPKYNKEMTEMANNSNNSNQILVPGAEQAINQMKVEIAQEFGVNLGADTTSRANGSVGGEITKRLVSMAQQQLGGSR